MRRLIPRKLLLQLGFTTLCFPALANGQIFARAALEVEGAENAACGLSSCPPQVLTYGYYHEHWRRWPEEASSPLAADSLSPFARPPRSVPAVDVPDPRTEDSMAPRRSRGGSRGSQGTNGAATATPPAARPAAPSAVPPALEPSGPNEADQQPETLPDRELEPFEPSPQLPDDGGFFPPTDSGSGALPETFPQDDFESPLPPSDLDQGLPTDRLNEPAENNADDVFDLDDFSQVDPRRLQRYRMSARGQMRRPGATRPRPTPRATAEQRSPMRLAAYRPSREGRRNPLRASGTPAQPTEPARMVEPAAWEFEPIAAEPSTAPPSETLQWTEPLDAAPAASRRGNPLR